MRNALLVSVALGIAWNVIAMWLMSGETSNAFTSRWFFSGVVAGLAAGWFTIWSRRRRQGKEGWLYVLATYYLGILVYWAAQVVIHQVSLIVQRGGWTGFNLFEHLNMITVFLVFGSTWFALILIPLSFFSRKLVWNIYCRETAQGK
jgi:hypothetical protein